MSGQLRARLRHRHPDLGDEGMTLVELMVTVALIGIILPVMYSTVDIFGNQASATANRLTAEADVQIAMDRLTKELRAAIPVAEGSGSPVTYPAPTAFVTATANSMTFYASLGSATGPSKVSVRLAPIGTTGVDQLVETITAASPGGVLPNETYTAAARTQVDASIVLPAATSFAYADSSGTASPPPASIEAVTLTITSRVNPTAPAVTLVSTVHLENVDLATAAN